MHKAWVYRRHGPKEVLLLDSLPLPVPLHGQLLVQIKAAALNPIDFKRRDSPILPTVFPSIPGCDMAGVVVAVGGGVSNFHEGDAVYGNVQDAGEEGRFKQRGTLAEYVAVEETLVASKPPNLSFEEAASLPAAAQTALEGFKKGGFRSGQSVFVVGGAGGVGSMAVQLAKHCLGASAVVATCSTKKLDFVLSLGADAAVDYTTTQYDQIPEKFDFVFDTIGESSRSAAVARAGAAVVDIASWPVTNARAIHSGITVSGEILESLRPYLEQGTVKAVIDPRGPYKFVDVIDAFAYLETGRAWGKVVITAFPSDLT